MDFQDEENNSGITSKFNAGVSQMNRLHNLQEQLNDCKIQPLAIFDNGMLGIDLWFNTLRCLYMEVRSKCTSKEQKDTDILFKEIRNTLDENIDNIYIKDQRLASGISREIRKEVYNNILDLLIFLEGIVKNLLEVHKLNSTSQENNFY